VEFNLVSVIENTEPSLSLFNLSTCCAEAGVPRIAATVRMKLLTRGASFENVVIAAFEFG
jgi:hypothetical protein